jgi:glutamate-1-semialdehyde 2,1-aminomutase/spore coat polysaccharide biosynthesis protein SpsF
MKEKLTKSNALLKDSLDIIPLASQTFSKSYLYYPRDHSPLFLKRGNGAMVWDIDGNQYLDMVSGLMAIVLGYNDSDVNQAIINQLSQGISFSLATELEYQLASLLVNHIPCAEMVRFGKTGTDVTSAAIRVARAYTNRDHILVCGYHGWQDWYIGTTSRSLGVPNAVSHLTQTVPYNDLDALEALLKTNKYAAFILEPTNAHPPKTGYLEGVRELTSKYNTVLVFDEIVTGFHFALGGAQEYFGVTPDLACFGKGLGNGMPLSAVVGKRDIMKTMDDIFFSGTFGGEALSLAAGIAVIQKMTTEPVIQHLWDFGTHVHEDITSIIKECNLEAHVQLLGYAPWKILMFSNHATASSEAIKTFFQKEMIANGVLILASHNISFAMKEKEREMLKNAYVNTLEKLAYFLSKENLIDNLNCPIIQPVFKIR